MTEEKYFVIINLGEEDYSLDVVDTEEEALGFVEHPSSYTWIKFIKGRELKLELNPSLVVGEEL